MAVTTHRDIGCLGVVLRDSHTDTEPKKIPRMGSGKQTARSPSSSPGTLFIAPASQIKPANGTPSAVQRTDNMVAAFFTTYATGVLVVFPSAMRAVIMRSSPT
jgi:hypothetical protein